MSIFRNLVLIVLLCINLTWAEGNQTEASKNAVRLSPEQIRADFTQLYQELQTSHYNLFINTARPEFDRIYQKTLNTIDQPLTVAEVSQIFQTFTAHSHVAHTRIESQSQAFNEYVESDGKIIPLAIRVVAGRVYVAEDLTHGAKITAGDELLKLNGREVVNLLAQLRRHLSADNDYLAHTMMEFEFHRLLWQELGSQDQFQLKLRNSEGAAFTVQLAALSRAEIRTRTADHSAAHETDTGKSLALSWSEHEARMLDEQIAYLRPGPFYQPDGENLWDTAAFAHFIDTSFIQFIKSGARKLLIDLRNNPGGDNSFSDLMVRWFATPPYRFCSDFRVKNSLAAQASNQAHLLQSSNLEVSQAYAKAYAQHALAEVFSFPVPMVEPRSEGRFQGDIYVLINRHSYSNTVTVAAIVQDYGFGQILGEETADLATTLGAMEHFSLTHSKIQVGFPKAEIIRPSGIKERRSVTPDVLIQTPVVEGAEDPVLRQALAHIRSQ